MSPSELKNLISQSYKSIGATKADYLYLISDFRTLGTHAENFESKDAFFNAFVEPLLELGKTVVIPAYSYTSSGTFDVRNTPTHLGALSAWFLKQKEVERSEHPLFSEAALGPNADIVLNVDKELYGKNCVYERLMKKGAHILHIGRPVSLGVTFVHMIEDHCKAPYRFTKTFDTKVYKDGKLLGSGYNAYVRRNDVPGHDFITEFTRAAARMHKAGFIKEVGNHDELTNFSCYDLKTAADFLTQLYREDPNIFIEKPFPL